MNELYHMEEEEKTTWGINQKPTIKTQAKLVEFNEFLHATS